MVGVAVVECGVGGGDVVHGVDSGAGIPIHKQQIKTTNHNRHHTTNRKQQTPNKKQQHE